MYASCPSRILAQEWITLERHAALAGRSLVLVDRRALFDPELSEEENHEELTGTCAPGCESLEQSRIRGREGAPFTGSGS
jgi:hypothetical protein